MSTAYSDLPVVQYEGPQSANPLAYRWYDAKRVVLGKTLAEQLRPAVCFWHTFCWGGQDPFALGGPLFERPWFDGEPMAAARQKLDAAFDFFGKLGLPYWCFHAGLVEHRRQRGAADRGLERGGQAVDRPAGRRTRREDGEPFLDHQTRTALLRQGGHIRQVGTARRTRGGEQAQAAAGMPRPRACAPRSAAARSARPSRPAC